MPALLPVIFAASQLVLAAQDVPQFDIAPGCRAAADTGVRSGDRAGDACLHDEQQAREKMKQEWNTFSDASQLRCVRLSNSGGAPSYVELLTCLEMAKAAKDLPAQDRLNDRLNGFGGR